MSTEIQKQQPTLPWKQALINAEHKFMAITDPKKAKIELGFAVQIIEANPKLKECSQESIQNAVINVARLSVTLNPALKFAYMIPRKGKCVLDLSYMGLIKVLTDGGDVKYMTAVIVYDDEDFVFDPINTRHVPKYPETEELQKKRKIHGALSMAILKDDTRVYEFMPRWELEKIKKQSQGADSSYSPYAGWETEMYKKSVIRRHYKFLPKGNPDHERLAALEELQQAEYRAQQAEQQKRPSVVDMMDDAVETPYQEVESTVQMTGQATVVENSSEPAKSVEEPPLGGPVPPDDLFKSPAETVTPSIKPKK